MSHPWKLSDVERRDGVSAVAMVRLEAAETRLAELQDRGGWLIRCLKDVIARKPVRGLDEAIAAWEALTPPESKSEPGTVEIPADLWPEGTCGACMSPSVLEAVALAHNRMPMHTMEVKSFVILTLLRMAGLESQPKSAFAGRSPHDPREQAMREGTLKRERDQARRERDREAAVAVASEAKLLSRAERAEAALRFYAERSNYFNPRPGMAGPPPVVQDNGEIARAALSPESLPADEGG